MTPFHKRLVLAVITAAIGATLWLSRRQSFVPDEKTGMPHPIRTREAVPDFEKEQATADLTARRRIQEDWTDLLSWLRGSPPPEEIRARLTALRKEWTAMDPQVLAEAIDRLLKAGGDAPTGLAFKVGNHGFLAGWPTARVFLLDVLAAADPEMAPEIAKRLLDQTTSADEFATGLRSLTRKGMGRADDAELLTRFGQMLGRTEWRNSPGFAEALDLARFVGSPAAARQLAAWNGTPALKSMAMNEFAAEHPAAMLAALNAETRIDATARANLMARINPEDPAQLAAVDAYFRSPDRSAEEAAAFLKSFPLRSVTTGYRLYGETPSPYSYERIAAGDRMAKAQVDAWVADPAVQQYLPELRALQERLAKWTEQAK